MNVKLISYSKPHDSLQGLQDLVAYCARVSNPANQNNTETNEKLIRYLIKHQHWSPLDMFRNRNNKGYCKTNIKT